jgi:tRNA G37 N-methylase Trm5
MNKVKYWYGVYRDYTCNIKIAQLCLSVDDLSCEILDDPGCITFYYRSRKDAIKDAKSRAKLDGCIKLELNFEKYRELKIKLYEPKMFAVESTFALVKILSI